MKYTGEETKYDKSSKVMIRMFFLVLTPIVIYSLCLIPPVAIITLFFYYVQATWQIIVFLPFVLMISFLVLVVSSVFITGGAIRGFHLIYRDGRYGKSMRDKVSFRFSLYYALYRPTVKLIHVFFLSPLYATYLRLVGAKIGKNVFFGGRNNIADPCAVEIGDNTLIGGGASILSHLGEDKLIIKTVKIGKNCLVGGEALVMPGVIMEDYAVLGGKSLATKYMVLKSKTHYGGVPAQELKKDRKSDGKKDK